jgi:kynurenine aminotransferase
MWERTITVGSAGKSFACTGWRVGWLIGPKSLVGPSLAAQTRIVFATNSPLQEAAAAGLEEATKRGFFQKQLEEYQERRDVLLKYFDEIGLKYSVPFGTYFVLVVRPLCIWTFWALTSRTQDVSDVQIPDNYPFPKELQGRGRDF